MFSIVYPPRQSPLNNNFAKSSSGLSLFFGMIINLCMRLCWRLFVVAIIVLVCLLFLLLLACLNSVHCLAVTATVGFVDGFYTCCLLCRFMLFSISTHHVLNMLFAVFVLFASKCEHILVWFFQNSIIATAPKICHMGLTPKMGWEWTDDVSCFIGLGNICSRHILYLCMELYFGLWVLKVTLSRCDLEVCLQHIFESSLGCGLAVVQYAFRVCCW